MNFTKIVIVLMDSGCDKVSVVTDLPEPCWPYESTGNQLRFETPPDKAQAYVETHFPGVPVEVIDARQKSHVKFSK